MACGLKSLLTLTLVQVSRPLASISKHFPHFCTSRVPQTRLTVALTVQALACSAKFLLISHSYGTPTRNHIVICPSLQAALPRSEKESIQPRSRTPMRTQAENASLISILGLHTVPPSLEIREPSVGRQSRRNIPKFASLSKFLRIL